MCMHVSNVLNLVRVVLAWSTVSETTSHRTKVQFDQKTALRDSNHDAIIGSVDAHRLKASTGMLRSHVQ
eukprot:m.194250 g.194250  ORF g.194250 m.194250 type:complete len:69 (+) comp15202_c0_seq1:339-545(+)